MHIGMSFLSIPQAYQRGVLLVYIAVWCQRRGRIQGAKLYLVYSCYCRRGSISRLAAGKAAKVNCNSSTVPATGPGSQAYWREVLLIGRSSTGVLARSLSTQVAVQCKRRVVRAAV